MSFVHRPRAFINGVRRTRTYRFFWCHHCDRTVRITSPAHTYIFQCPLCYNILCQELHVSRPNFTVQAHESSSSTEVQMTRPAAGSPTTSEFDDCMPVARVTDDMLEDNPSCAVCKEDFVVDELIRRMPCGHLYHSGCILPWIRVNDTCPICRFRVSLPRSCDNDSNIGGSESASRGVDQDVIDDFRFEEALNLTWPTWDELLSLLPFGFGSFFNWSSSQYREDSLTNTASNTTGRLLNVFTLEF